MTPASSLPLHSEGLWQPSLFNERGVLLSLIGIFALLAYAALSLTTDQFAELGQRLMILSGFVSLLLYGRERRTSPIVWLLVGAILVVLISWGLSHWSHPEWAERSPKVHRLTHWFICIPVAWWLGGQQRNVFLIWTTALGGLLIAPWLTGGGWNEWLAGLQGGRIDFGIHNAQHTAMLFGIALIGLISLGHRAFRKTPWRWLRVLLLFPALSACVVAVFITQTRGVWLGLLGAAVTLAGFVALALARRSRHKRLLKITLGTLFTLGVISVLVVPRVDQFVETRIESERDTVQAAILGRIADVPYDSAGIRIHTWVEALHWIEQRPLVGWGGNGRGLIFEHSNNLPAHVKAGFSHLHNSYLDLLVNYGVLGLLLYAALLGWLVFKSVQLWRQDLLPGDILSFFLAFTTFWLIVNMFESYMFFSSGSFIFSLICGGLLTLIWAGEHKKKPREA